MQESNPKNGLVNFAYHKVTLCYGLQQWLKTHESYKIGYSHAYTPAKWSVIKVYPCKDELNLKDLSSFSTRMLRADCQLQVMKETYWSWKTGKCFAFAKLDSSAETI